MYRTIDFFSFGVARVPSQRFFSRTVKFVHFVEQYLICVDKVLYLFDNLLYNCKHLVHFDLKTMQQICPWLHFPNEPLVTAHALKRGASQFWSNGKAPRERSHTQN